MTRPLTSRQAEIMRLLADGLTPGEIGRELWLSTETIRWHIKGVYARLGVHTRGDALAALELPHQTCCHACGRPLEDAS